MILTVCVCVCVCVHACVSVYVYMWNAAMKGFFILCTLLNYNCITVKKKNKNKKNTETFISKRLHESFHVYHTTHIFVHVRKHCMSLYLHSNFKYSFQAVKSFKLVCRRILVCRFLITNSVTELNGTTFWCTVRSVACLRPPEFISSLPSSRLLKDRFCL